MPDRKGAQPSTTDQWIDVLRARRSKQPDAPLSNLLDTEGIPADQLVDLACIDLMDQRRAGRPVNAVEYARDLPSLGTDEHALDLIDAEICIRRELGDPVDIATIAADFKHLKDRIRELLSLHESVDPELAFGPAAHPRPNSPTSRFSEEQSLQDRSSSDRTESLKPTHESTLDGESIDPSASFTVDLKPKPEAVDGDAVPELNGHPLRIPEWFVPDHCHSSAKDTWLIRGRDATRGDVLALKIVKIAAAPRDGLAGQILDACEQASKIRHALWVAPQVAAVQHGYLGLIRPWIFATPMLAALTNRDVVEQQRELASLAYCVAAAHAGGATHGAVQASNLLLDHDNQLHLVDAVATRNGLDRWLAPPNTRQLPSLNRRRQQDAEDLVRLVGLVASSSVSPWPARLMNELVRILQSEPERAAESIAQQLIQSADSPSQPSTSIQNPWYRGFARWFGSER